MPQAAQGSGYTLQSFCFFEISLAKRISAAIPHANQNKLSTDCWSDLQSAANAEIIEPNDFILPITSPHAEYHLPRRFHLAIRIQNLGKISPGKAVPRFLWYWLHSFLR